MHPLGIKTLWNAFNPWNGANTIVKSGNEEINELNKVLQDVETKLENAIARAGKATVTTTTYGEEGDALQKQKKDIRSNMKNLEPNLR
ncbi:hypothetical protein NXY31_06020 [Bacteroides salyersiae]|nr:hypothetical protein [Bacteroides salyersiae]